jgi:hypothetical protein
MAEIKPWWSVSVTFARFPCVDDATDLSSLTPMMRSLVRWPFNSTIKRLRLSCADTVLARTGDYDKKY